MRIAVLGVDLGKNVCSLVGLDASGAVVLRRRAKRETVIALAAKLSPCIVGMEACCGAHHLGRVFAAYGRAEQFVARLRGVPVRAMIGLAIIHSPPPSGPPCPWRPSGSGPFESSSSSSRPTPRQRGAPSF